MFSFFLKPKQVINLLIVSIFMGNVGYCHWNKENLFSIEDW